MSNRKPELLTQSFDYLFPYRALLPFRKHVLRRKEKYKPFFIIGSGRSGTTLLRRILQHHKELHIPPETYVLGSIIRAFQRNRYIKWKDLVYLCFSYLEYQPEFITFKIESLGPLANKLSKAPKHLRSLAFIVDSFYRYHAYVHKLPCERWGDKTPINTFSLERIIGVFPEAQFIHIVRDGCDVVNSYVEAKLYNNVVDAAQRWKESVETASDFCNRHAERCIEIRYEHLVERSSETTQIICSFLNVSYFSNMIEDSSQIHTLGDVTQRPHHAQVLQPISPSSIGKGRRDLSIEDKQLIHKIIEKPLLRFGYRSCLL